MNNDPTPRKKQAPVPSRTLQDKAKYFEEEYYEYALKAYKDEDYLKAAMTSWSYIEEFFLPTVIKYIAEKQKIKYTKSMVDGMNAANLIKVYYFISYDEELYSLFEKARGLRNKLVHKAYGAGSIPEIERLAKISADFNIKEVMLPLLKRLSGDEVPPSLLLYIKGWNDLRDKMKKYSDDRIKELKAELKKYDK